MTRPPFDARAHGINDRERGQVLVIVAVLLTALVAMVGLVIDGGHAWGQQRDVQNASDAAAEAGAIKLAQNLPFRAASQTEPNGNAEVRAAVQAAAAARQVTVREAWYTDFFGTRIASAPLIGPGQLGSGPAPTQAEGIEVIGEKQFDTFIAQIVGINQMTASTPATAVAGYAETIDGSSVMPVTIPVNVTTCTNTNGVYRSDPLVPWPLNTPQIIPLCSNGPGNVGWLDWTPPAGGTSELRDAILTPNNPELAIPGWYFVSQTGNISASQVESALNSYASGNREVLIPLFDATCSTQPANPAGDACTTGEGTGQNQWYHLAGWIALDLEWVDMNGGRRVCESGNGATGCMKGELRQVFYSGTIRRATGNETAYTPPGINLIR